MLNRSGTILDKPAFRSKRMLDHLPEMLNKTDRMLNIWEKMWNDRGRKYRPPSPGPFTRVRGTGTDPMGRAEGAMRMFAKRPKKDAAGEKGERHLHRFGGLFGGSTP
jgi:hypothetical protein